MKIIITESQLTMLDWFLENKEELDSIFNKIISNDFYFRNVIFKPLNEVIDSVVNELYDEWSYNHNSFSGESSIKEYIFNHYSDKIKNLYRQLKKKYPQHNF